MRTHIISTQTGDFCPGGNGYQAEDVAMEENMLLNAYNLPGRKEVTVNGHKFNEYLCDQVLSLKVI